MEGRKSTWSPARHELPALHLGRFNGAYLAGKELPSCPWLSRNSARGLIDSVRWVLASIEDRVQGARDHTVIRFLRDAEPVLDALEQLPQTVCHLDAGYYNLM